MADAGERVTVESATEFAAIWRDEATRYSALARTADGDVAHGYRAMASDAEAFAAAFEAAIAIAAAHAENARMRANLARANNLLATLHDHICTDKAEIEQYLLALSGQTTTQNHQETHT